MIFLNLKHACYFPLKFKIVAFLDILHLHKKYIFLSFLIVTESATFNFVKHRNKKPIVV